MPVPKTPPRAALSARSDRASLAPAVSTGSPPSENSSTPQRERERETDGNSPGQGSASKGTPRSREEDWDWSSSSKGNKGKGVKGKGKKGKTNVFWSPWGYWVDPNQWTRPKKKNRGLARVDWWAARTSQGKGKGKTGGKGAKGDTPASAETPPEVAVTATAPESTGGTSTPADVPVANDSRSESERALRERQESWADASEEPEEARREDS